MKKDCKKCGEAKSLAAFYFFKDDRYSSYCKPCELSKQKLWREKNKEKRKAYDKARREQRWAYQREYNEKNRDKKREYDKANKDRYLKLNQERKKKYPEKAKARSKLAYALSTGKLIRQPCLICQSNETHGHHEDYNSPLQVLWLCRSHHLRRHAGAISLTLLIALNSKSMVCPVYSMHCAQGG